jgi:glycosyltransferase involved in cell wall biosynthesis
MDTRIPLRLAVLIPAYNEESNLGKLLTFLRNYESASVVAPLELRVWVDVSGSSDRTPEIAREFGRRWPAVHVVDTGVRDGLIRALDRMLGVADGDIMLRLDADVSLTSETLDTMLVVLLSRGASIVGPRIVPANSPSSIVTRLSRAEYNLHHRVSLESAKTTLVQMFRGVPVHLRLDSPIEDHELQCQLTSTTGPAAYAPDAMVTVVPPTNVRDFLMQRIRTIQHINLHRRRGYTPSPTDSTRLVVPALLEELRAGSHDFEVLLFVVVECLARFAARWLSFLGSFVPFQWQPIVDTKQPHWTIPLSTIEAGDITRAGDNPRPLLSR